MTGSHAAARRPALARLRAYHAAAPVASATTIYLALALALVRLAGAWTMPLMVLSVGLSALVLAVLPRDRWAAEAGLRRFRARPALGGIALTIVAYAVTVGAARAAFGRGHDNWSALAPDLFRSMAPGMPWLYVPIMLVSMAVLVPVVEEVCYRGVLFGAIDRRCGPAVANLLLVGWATWFL
jgi:CAAX protease family protein